MDAGQVKEYAAPSELLADDTSIFFSMARDAGLVAWAHVHSAHNLSDCMHPVHRTLFQLT